MKLEYVLKNIEPLNAQVMEAAQKKLDNLTKPLGSLGKLEGMAKRLAGIREELIPSVKNKYIIIMCADNGVTDKGVSSCPKSVTKEVTINFTKGFTGVNVLARHAGARLHVIDIGVDADIQVEGVINKKIRKGTWDISEGAAMTRDEVIKAIEIGIEAVGELKEKGADLLGTGEMGIGNTTTSSAVAAAITGASVEEMVGKGAGLTREGYEAKIQIVKRAIEINRPNAKDGIDVLQKLGGFDIAGLTGCFIGAAYYRLPILIDGFISSAAALAAITIAPNIKDYIFTSHGSAEPGAKRIFQYLDMEPYLFLDMRLGEGTGVALGFHIIDAAIAAYSQMGTFNDANIEKYVPLD